MVIEVATLFVKDEAEADFVRDFTEGAEILRRQPGCKNLRWGKRVEPELAFILEVEWGEIQDHFNFREADDFATFGATFRAYLSKAPEVVHFEPGS